MLGLLPKLLQRGERHVAAERKQPQSDTALAAGCETAMPVGARQGGHRTGRMNTVQYMRPACREHDNGTARI